MTWRAILVAAVEMLNKVFGFIETKAAKDARDKALAAQTVNHLPEPTAPRLAEPTPPRAERQEILTMADIVIKQSGVNAEGKPQFTWDEIVAALMAAGLDVEPAKAILAEITAVPAADRKPSTYMLAAAKALTLLAPLADQVYRDATD